jgi:predicted ATPase
LDEDDIVTLVTARYQLPALDQTRLVAYLQERAEGNPFFTGELLRSLAEERVLRPVGDGWTVRELAGIRLPPLLRQVIDGRIVRLGEEARESLAVAAVIGQEVALDL